MAREGPASGSALRTACGEGTKGNGGRFSAEGAAELLVYCSCAVPFLGALLDEFLKKKLY